ncbi:DevR family CRISPR-associated autoregulator [Candidatus Bathyarchaeota archaeon]|nr:DevR family CRISPR-associated autoregulator [Candidatus Bathyarchaeota archaeon]
MNEQIYEIGIAARIKMNAHSLNNEGTTGNVTEPRTVVLADGRKTDGISGEMLKHIHAAYLFHLAKEEKENSLCESCKSFNPMKADGNSKLKGKSVVDALNEALSCELCDIHGFLVQEPTLSRKSTVEFGWALALPEQFHRDIHVHTRVAPGEKTREKGVSEQMIYNRPTRSGVYAFISVFQPWRIGLNEVNYTYKINDPIRKKRYDLAIDSYKSMFTRIEGAMTTTRMPHIEDIEGVMIKTDDAQPVPLISPLKEDYIKEIEKISQSVQKFTSLSELLKALDNLKQTSPYKLGA